MNNKEIIEFIEENDVKFIRLSFCNPFGEQKNISIMADELEGAFKNGISFDASAIKGFSEVDKSDLLLFPDPETLALLPWRPNVNSVLRFYCDIKNPNNTNFESDSRYILKKAIQKLHELGFDCKFGTECEFYLFKTDDDGNPTTETLDKGGYLDVAPLDKGENVRREICLCLEEMGLNPERSHHEQGPGQNEIDFKFSDVLTAADNFLTFKSVVKATASRNGLFASFMPKPFLDKSGNGMHTNISLYKDGVNLFCSKTSENYRYAENFIAGILEKVPDITLFLNPNNNSYERLGQFEAPKYVSWSHENRSQLIRIPFASDDKHRFELRSPDPSINPYLAFALMIYAGIYGIENSLSLPPSTDENLFKAEKDIVQSLNQLPQSLSEAINVAQNSEFIKQHIDSELLQKIIEIKSKESLQYINAKGKADYYINTYFERL